MRGEARGHSTGNRSYPEIAAIDESNPVVVNVRKAQQLGLRPGERREQQTQKCVEKRKTTNSAVQHCIPILL